MFLHIIFWRRPGQDKGQGQRLGKGQNQNNNGVGKGDLVMASKQVRQRGQHDGIFLCRQDKEDQQGLCKGVVDSQHRQGRWGPTIAKC